MKAWNIDANTINTGEINLDDLNNWMVTTRAIKDFLSFDTRKMFIVGPKGLGKTFLLKIKSQLYRNTGGGYKFIPAESLCETFTSNDISFSEKELLKFTERAIWNKTWELCLYSLILRNFKDADLPSEITHVIGEDASVLSEILGAFLQERSNIDKLHSLVAIKLKPAVRKLWDNSNVNQIAVFIDNIDESFDSYVGFTAKNEGNLKASSIWINSQLSLLNVARDICRSNHHIKIFLSVRSEAYKNFVDPLKLQIDDQCLFLEYSKQEIREIFDKNINLTQKEDLITTDSDDTMVNLLGYKQIPHKFIQDDNGVRRKEDVFEFIYRHTYARPRDIVLMGKSIIERTRPNERDNTELIGSIVNEQSYNLFGQLKNETIPVFEEEIFEKFCLKVKSNVITFEEAYKISLEFKSEGFDNVLSYFYRLGLIGAVESFLSSNVENGGGLKQSFLPVGQYSLTAENIPEYQYFVLHPSLNKRMKQIYDVGFYDRFNILGYDYPFYPQRINRLENHFHFGLDRDSVTAIIPLIHTNKCLAILAPSSGEWNVLSKMKTFILKVNGIEYPFKVYNENLPEVEKNEIKKDWKDKKYHVVIFTSYIEEIVPFFERSVTSSLCMLDPYIDILKKMILNSDMRFHQFSYYCMRVYDETNHISYRKIIEKLGSDVEAEVLLYDRFQYSSEVLFNIETGVMHCEVNTENYCSLICRNRQNATLQKNDKITIVYGDEEMNFFKLRQNLLLEGYYQFYKLLISKGYTKRSEYMGLSKCFIKIQSVRILEKYMDNEVSNLFNGKTRETVIRELSEYGNTIIKRVEKLYEYGVIQALDNDLAVNKEREIFPTEKNFFTIISMLQEFKQEASQLIKLKDLLELNTLRKYKNIFISYSSKDYEIVKFLSDRLVLAGLNISTYEQDNPVVVMNKYMSEVIQENDKMLFICSQNSLSSDACHIELANCIELARKHNNPDRLIILRLDDYVLNIKMQSVMDSQRQHNIDYLKTKSSLLNVFDMSLKKNLRLFDKWLNDFVQKSFT